MKKILSVVLIMAILTAGIMTAAASAADYFDPDITQGWALGGEPALPTYLESGDIGYDPAKLGIKSQGYYGIAVKSYPINALETPFLNVKVDSADSNMTIKVVCSGQEVKMYNESRKLNDGLFVFDLREYFTVSQLSTGAVEIQIVAMGSSYVVVDKVGFTVLPPNGTFDDLTDISEWETDDTFVSIEDGDFTVKYDDTNQLGYGFASKLYYVNLRKTPWITIDIGSASATMAMKVNSPKGAFEDGVIFDYGSYTGIQRIYLPDVVRPTGDVIGDTDFEGTFRFKFVVFGDTSLDGVVINSIKFEDITEDEVEADIYDFTSWERYEGIASHEGQSVRLTNNGVWWANIEKEFIIDLDKTPYLVLNISESNGIYVKEALRNIELASNTSQTGEIVIDLAKHFTAKGFTIFQKVYFNLQIMVPSPDIPSTVVIESVKFVSAPPLPEKEVLTDMSGWETFNLGISPLQNGTRITHSGDNGIAVYAFIKKTFKIDVLKNPVMNVCFSDNENKGLVGHDVFVVKLAFESEVHGIPTETTDESGTLAIDLAAILGYDFVGDVDVQIVCWEGQGVTIHSIGFTDKITDVSLKMFDTSISAAEVSTSVDIYNGTASGEAGKVILAVYEGNKLIGMGISDASSPLKLSNSLYSLESVPVSAAIAPTGSTVTVKAFYWNDENDIIPISAIASDTLIIE